MDVDIPQTEEAMETDPPIIEHQQPQLTRKDSIIDPDGDEVMQGDEEVYEDEDIEIGDGDGDAEGEEGGEEIEAEEEYVEGEGDYDVDLEGGDDQGIGETQDESLDTEEGDVAAVDTGATTAEDLPSAPQDDTSAPVQNAETTAPTVHDTSGGAGNEPTNKVADTASHAHTEGVAETKVEGAAEQEHIEGDHHEEGDAADQDHTEGDHHEEGDEVEEEDGEEEYDLLTSETLPPIILNLPNSRIALFNTISTDSELPLWFSERIEELCEGTLTQLWAAIRVQLDSTGEGNGEGEMVITEKLMDLKMGDVSLFLVPISKMEK